MASINPNSVLFRLSLESTPAVCRWFQYQSALCATWIKALDKVEGGKEEWGRAKASLVPTAHESGQQSISRIWLAQHFDNLRFAICRMEIRDSVPHITELVAAPMDQIKSNIEKNLKSLPYPLNDFFTRLLKLSPAQCQTLVHTISMEDPLFFDCMLEFFPKEGVITEATFSIKREVKVPQDRPRVPKLPRPINVDWKEFSSHVDAWTAFLENTERFYSTARCQPEQVEVAMLQALRQGQVDQTMGRSSARQYYAAALPKIVTDIFDQYVPEGNSILELGSYKLTDGLSALSVLVPKEVQARWVYSDVNRTAVSSAQADPKRTNDYINLDVLELGPLTRRGVGTIVSLNVFDTLTRGEVRTAIQRVFNFLPSGGQLITFTERSPFLAPQVAHLVAQGQFVSVRKHHITNQTSGVISAPAEIVKDNIQQALPSMPPKLKDFFQRFLTLGNHACADFVRVNNLRGDGSFLRCFNHFFPTEGVSQMDHCQAYFDDVTSALQERGFQIRVAEMKANNIFVKSPQATGFQQVIQDVSGIICTGPQRISGKPNGTAINAKLHVIVAVKP